MQDLPEGFTLDSPVSQELPEGFVLDEPAGITGPIIPGESTSTITGSLVSGQEVMQNREGIPQSVGRPIAEMGGMIGGEILGAASPVPGGMIAGGGVGYATGKKLADIAYGDETGGVVDFAKDVATGSAMSAGGVVLGKGIGKVFNVVGDIGKSILGGMTGKGKGAIEEALKGSKGFIEGIRGEVEPSRIVNNAQSALGKIKEKRAAEYLPKLEQIKNIPTQLNEIKTSLTNKVRDLMSKDKFDIKPIIENGNINFDFSESTLVEGQPIINKALTDISKWSDFSAKGLDTLKRRIGTYVNQTKKGTPQYSFLNQIKGELSDGLKNKVPGYKEMTKAYSDASTLIDDISSGLMMRPEGIQGRIVADQTLRRLISSMKDNFVLRRELAEALSKDGGEDITGQIAGYAMRDWIPAGIAGSGPALIGGGVASALKPELIPIFAASSPRLVGEFMQIYGKALGELGGIPSKAIGKAIPYGYVNIGNKQIPIQDITNTIVDKAKRGELTQRQIQAYDELKKRGRL